MRCFGKKIQTYHCKVVLLDEQELIQEIQDTTPGQEVLDTVFRHLNLLETAYFGLRYLDSSNQTHWLDPTKKVAKQLKGTDPFTLYFGVKFYAADPCKLLEEITRYQFFLQVKQDILQGRLPVSFDLAAELGSYVVQSELGDYDPRRHSPGYVSEFRFLSNQTVELESRIAELHKALVGQIPAVAELNYLEKVKWLDMYGVDLHPVLGEDNVEYFLGLTPSGIIVLRNKTKVGNYYWPRITKVYFKGRYFMLRVCDKNNDENTYGFETPSKEACKHLWKCCVEHHAFFRLVQVSPQTTENIFALGSRFSGRTEKQAQRDAQLRLRNPPQFSRTPSRRYQRRIVEGAQDAPKVEETVNNENIPPQEMKTVSIPQPVNSVSSIYRSSSIPNVVHRSDSPRSTRSAPWTQPNKGLYTGASPRSVRSAGHNPNQFLNRLTRRSSSVESQSSNESRSCKRHRHHRSRRGSDNDSEVSKSSGRSHGHRRHRSHQKRDLSNESDHHHKHRHRKHRHGSNYELVDSEAQWKEVQRKQAEGQPGIQQATVVRDLGGRKSGYMNSGMETESEASYHNKKKNKKHRSRSRSPSENKPRLPDELKKHLEFNLIETEGMSEDQLKQIPYKVVETNSKPLKIKFSPNTKRRQQSPRRSKSSTQDERFQPPNSGDSPPPPYSPPNGVVPPVGTEIPGALTNSSVNFIPTSSSGDVSMPVSAVHNNLPDFLKNSAIPAVAQSPAGSMRSNHLPRRPVPAMYDYSSMATTSGLITQQSGSSGLTQPHSNNIATPGLPFNSSLYANSGNLIRNGSIPNGHVGTVANGPHYPPQNGVNVSHEHSDSGLGADSQDFICSGRTSEGPKYAQTTKLSTTFTKPVSISKAYPSPSLFSSMQSGHTTPTSNSTHYTSSHSVNHYSSVQKYSTTVENPHAYRNLSGLTNTSGASGELRQNRGLGWLSGAPSQGLYSTTSSSSSSYQVQPLSENSSNQSNYTHNNPSIRCLPQESKAPPTLTNPLGNWNYPTLGELPRLQGMPRLGSERSVRSVPAGGWPLYFQSSGTQRDSIKSNTTPVAPCWNGTMHDENQVKAVYSISQNVPVEQVHRLDTSHEMSTEL